MIQMYVVISVLKFILFYHLCFYPLYFWGKMVALSDVSRFATELHGEQMRTLEIQSNLLLPFYKAFGIGSFLT